MRLCTALFLNEFCTKDTLAFVENLKQVSANDKFFSFFRC